MSAQVLYLTAAGLRDTDAPVTLADVNAVRAKNGAKLLRERDEFPIHFRSKSHKCTLVMDHDTNEQWVFFDDGAIELCGLLSAKAWQAFQDAKVGDKFKAARWTWERVK